ncbi:MAG TPA: carboxypeptidase regulatory-like domain-containing protein [Vicinamibacterales bacterium]|jgi:hypothetical protein
MKNSMRQLMAIALAAMVSTLSPWAIPLSAAGRGQATASLAGTAQSAPGQVLANVAVQLRDLATGQLVGTTTSSATGSFGFAGLAAGNYSVEIVSAAGQIVGASAAIPVAAGAAVSGVTVTASAAAALAAGGAAAGVAAAAGGGATVFGISSAVIVATAAAGAGIAAIITVVPTASSSQ